MTPDDFIRKWQGVTLREKPAAQKHVLDLRALVGVESSAKADHRETGSAARRARPRPGGVTAGPMSGGVVASTGSTSVLAQT